MSIPIGVYTYTTIITSAHRQQHYNFKERRSGTTKAANGGRPGPIDAVGRIDVAAAVEVEAVGVGAVRVRGRRPVVAVVAGILEQIAGILPDVAAPNLSNWSPRSERSHLRLIQTIAYTNHQTCHLLSLEEAPRSPEKRTPPRRSQRLRAWCLFP